MKKLTKLKTSIISLCAVVCAVILGLSISLSGENSAYAYRTLPANKIANIYDGEKFDFSRLDSLAVKAGYTNFEAMVTGAESGTIKKANQFGTDTVVDFGSYTFGGTKRDLTWIPSYLSKDASGNAVLTLWLATNANANGTLSNQEISTYSDGTHEYTFGSSYTKSYTDPNGGTANVYSSTYDGSYIRNVMICGRGSSSYTKAWGYKWDESSSKAVTISGSPAVIPADLTKFSQLSSGSLSSYLIAPKNISWITSQSAMNDSSYNGSGNYNKSYYPTKWQNDLLWLPSEYEIKASGLWNISTSQRISAANYWTPTRTATTAYSSEVVFFDNDGSRVPHAVSRTYSVRPAINLNLSKILRDFTLENPTDLTYDYNGSSYTLNSLAVKPSWYDATKYADSAKVQVTYPSGGIKNAGDYYVKVEVNNLKFRGNPDTSDSAHMESDTVRWFKFTIKPIEITVTKPSYNASTGVFTAPTITNSGALFSDAPTIATRFTGTMADGTAVNQIDEFPSRRGLTPYTAQAILVNSPTDKTPYSGGNYVIKNASSMTCSIQINRARLAIPAAETASQMYNGGDIRFLLSGYTAEWREIATIVPADGVKFEGDDTNGWYIVAKEAGTYTLTAALKSDKKSDWCWNTLDGTEDLNDKAITVTIDRKTLFVDFLSSTGAFLMQKNANVTFSAEPSNAVEGDEVKIALRYYNADDASNPLTVPSGILDASTLEPGTYRLEAVLNDGAAADNKNYVIDVTASYQDFTISSKNITIESVNWQYSQNNGLPTILSGGDSAATPAAVTYNGSTFVISLANSAQDLATAGVKVDPTFGVNGYVNGLQLNAIDTPIAVTVRLIPYNAEWAFNDNNGKPLENQYKEFTVYIKVDKATIDFSKIEWSADELEYTALAQEVTIVSGLPAFIEPVYYDNSEWNIGEYTAGVFSLNVKDVEASKNYIVPSDASGIQPHPWKIVKKRIPVTWIQESSGEGDNVIFLPTLADNMAGAIEFFYYGAQEGVSPPTPDLTRVLSFTDIQNYDQTEYKNYFVCARLRAPTSDVRSFSVDNCVLIVGGAEATEAFQGFRLGGNKNPVIVSIEQNSVVYNGEQQPAKVHVDSGDLLTESDYTISYKEGVYNEDTGKYDYKKFSGIPSDAGVYKVVVTINKERSGTFAIKGEREFDYEIEKADFDMSDVKWVDVLNGDEEYTAPFVYNGKAHKLEYRGTPKVDGEPIEGYSVSCTEVEGTAVGTYTVKVTVSFAGGGIYAQNYNVPEDFEFTWEIEKCEIDLSAVTWNYNDDPFVFSIVGGEPVMYSAKLKFPEGYEFLQELIVYSGDNGEYSDAGFHTTSFALTTDPEILKNYGTITFSPLLETTLTDWEIAPLRIPKASASQTMPFRIDGYSFGEITNLPMDFAEYFEVKVYDASSKEIAQTDGTWTFVNAGRYRIQVLFRPGMNKSNGGKVDNVKWSDNSRSPYQVVLTITKLVLTATGWTELGGIDKPTLDTDQLDEIETYFDYVLKKQLTGESISLDDMLEYSTGYTIALKLKDGLSGNVAVNYGGKEVEETDPYPFQTENPFEIPPESFIEMPTGDDLTIRYRYTGDEITFEFGDWYDDMEMTVVSGEMSGTEVGDYPVVVGFLDGSICAWGTEENWNRNFVTVTFVIYVDDTTGKFILKDTAKKNAFKFQYEDFSELEGDIKDYVYGTDNVVYMTKLTCEDTLADLLAQFKNEDIKVYDEAGTPITDMTATLATGMILRLEDGGTVLNQLTISVLGDVDGDGDITTVDKAQLNAYSLGTLDLAGAKLLAGDIDDDGDITTVDKAQLNAYTLGSFDIYENLILKTATAQVLSVEAEEGAETVEENAVTLSETTVIEVEPSEEVRTEAKEVPEREETPAESVVLVDTKRLRVSF